MGEAGAEIDIYSQIASVSSRVEILGAANSTRSTDLPKIDDIDADAQETFTLEEMRVLIMNYKKRNKDFLIARVTTTNQEDNTHFYNFYYAAAEINRILFRYEPTRRLLHRMKVKNPLNNMYVMGQVFYYKITPHDVDKAIINYLFKDGSEKDKSRKAFSAVFRHKHDFAAADHRPASKDSMDIKEEPIKSASIGNKNTKEIMDGLSKGTIPMPAKGSEERKIRYCARYFASDDDFLNKQEVREYFQRNALEEEDEFLYDLDRTQNDFMALIDEDSQEEEEAVSDWRRVFSAHISIAFSLLFLCLLMGGGPGIAIIFLPLSVIIFFSFISSLCYVLCCRRSTFDTQAVTSVEESL